ncbi:MAG: PepSY domain-containing protein [Methylovulum sp.]|uniref:PepSY domain-containing protein n=1 Tax=Methylovulum sp. TaxID=1916980 RepID=UPI00260A0940|nr:PepSY domain-containing protein [Methylovulum sp.]MDD2722648.1 PepSY domain-containing protein [Methylovulum sp.]MDD5123880.1 PepSY domain-containing protein [Methylovulum sp.]
MHKRCKLTLVTVFAMTIMTNTVVTVAKSVEPKEQEAKELTLFSQTQISLSEAIKTAEQKIGGKALEAELADEANAVQFEVEVVKDGKIHKVMVDGKTGQVLKAGLDHEPNSNTDDDDD